MFGAAPFAGEPFGSSPFVGVEIQAGVSEVATASDTAAQATTAARTLTESTTASESSNRVMTAPRAQTEAAAGLDAPQVILLYAQRVQADPATATDTEVVFAVKAQLDTASANDAPDRTMSFPEDQTDSGAAVDTPNRTLSASPSQAEPASASDAPNRTLSASRTQADAAAATDAPNRTMSASGSQAEAAIAADASDRAMASTGAASETGAAGDAMDVTAVAKVDEYLRIITTPGSYPDVLDPALVYVHQRASAATYFDASGIVQTAPADTARFSYDPNTGLAPLLIEGASTNEVTNSRSNWAISYNPAALVRTANYGTAPDGVANSATRLTRTAGTGSAVFNFGTGGCPAMVNGTTKSGSFWINLVSVPTGTWTFSVYFGASTSQFGRSHTVTVTNGRITAVNNGGALLYTSASGWQRLSFPNVTSTGDYTGWDFTFSIGPTDFDILFWQKQMEPGALVTSDIFTAGSAVTRPADVAYVSNILETSSATMTAPVTGNEAASATDTIGKIAVKAQSDAGAATDAPNRTMSASRSQTEAATASDTEAAAAVAYRQETLGRTVAVFNGSSGHIQVADAPSLQNPNTLTIEFRVKGVIGTQSWPRLMAKASGTSTDGGWMVYSNSTTPNVGIRLDTAGTGGVFNQNKAEIANTLDGQIHHIVFTLNSGVVKSYKDGVLIANTTYAHGTGFTTNYPLRVGAGEGAGGNVFNGELSDVRIYGRVLSDVEIAQHASGVYVDETALDIWLPLAGDPLDDSGNLNNGTVVGTGLTYTFEPDWIGGALETESASMTTTRTQAEAGAANDTTNAIDVAGLNEPGAAADSPSATGSASRTQAETATATDVPAGATASTRTHAESATAAETSNRTMSTTRAQTDAGAGVDAPQVVLLYADRLQTEAASADDTDVVTIVATLDAADVSTATNTQSIQLAIAKPQAEPATAADVPNRSLTAFPSTTEAGAAVDTPSEVVIQVVQEFSNRLDVPGVYPQITAGQIMAFERATTACYFDSNGNLQTAPANTARFNYEPSTLATNKLFPSTPDNTVWTAHTTVGVAKYGIAPDGTTSTYFTQSATPHRYRNAPSTAGVPNTYSYYVRCAPTDSLRIYVDGNMGSGATFGSATASFSNPNAAPTLQGFALAATCTKGTGIYAGWYRVTMTYQAAGGTSVNHHIYPSSANPQEYWGCQVETGSVASPLIQTTTAAVTAATPWGLLIEGSDTNSVRNNTMQGAVAGSPGTLPTNWSGGLGVTNGVTFALSNVGTENGVPFIEFSVTGTATANFNKFYNCDNLAFQAVGGVGEVWTGSIFGKLQSGTLPNVPQFVVSGRLSAAAGGGDNDNAGAAFPTTGNALSTQRISATRTIASANTATIGLYFYFSCTQGVTYNFTYRVGAPQLEKDSVMSSVILTSTGVVTRAPDAAYIPVVDTPSAAATDPVTAVESATAADTTNAMDLAGLTEAATATDTSNRTPTMSRTQAEAGAAADTTSQVASLSKAGAEAASAAETQDRTPTMARAQAEANSAVDAPQVILMYADRVQTDVNTATDDTQVLLSVAFSHTETATATDTASQLPSLTAARQEPAAATDTPNKSMTPAVSQTEAAAAAEIISMSAVAIDNEFNSQTISTPGRYPQFIAGMAFSDDRNTVGTYFDASGTLQTAAAGQARFDYDPSTVRINYLVHSNLKTGTSAYYSLSGANVTDSGIDNSVTDPFGGVGARKFTVSASGSLRFATGGTHLVSGANNSPFAGSVYIMSADGVNHAINVDLNDLNTANYTTTTSWQRISTSAQRNGVDYRFFDINLVPGTYYMFGAQIEPGLTVTPYIPTTTAPVSVDATPLGLLVEGQSTNSVPNNTMVGASAGVAPTGWNMGYWTVVGKGVENGIDYIDVRLNRTNVNTVTEYGGIVMVSGVPGVPGETWTCSAFVRMIGGSTTGIVWGNSEGLRIAEQGTANAYNGVNPLTTGNGPLIKSRISRTTTLVSTTTSMQLNFQLPQAAGATVDITFRIGLPQLEKASAPSSPIKTANAGVVTRTADVVYVTTVDEDASVIASIAGSAAETAAAADTTNSIDIAGLTEAATAAESANRTLTASRSETDTASATETSSQVASIAGTQAEAGAANDTTNRLNSATGAQTETGTAADTTNRSMTASAAQAEAGAASETSAAPFTVAVTRTDSTPITETSNRTPTMARAQAEATTASDAPVTTLMYAWRFQDEPTTAADGTAVTLDVQLVQADNTSAGEASDTLKSAASTATESTTATETSNRIAGLAGTASEAGAATETESVAALKAQADANAASETTDRSLTASRSQADTTTAADTQTSAAQSSQTEANSASEASSQVTAMAKSQADAATATDAPVRSMNVPVSETDTASATETSNRTPTMSRAQAESTTANEAPAVVLMYADRSQAEPASATDTEVVITIVSRSDATPITDAASQVSTLTADRSDSVSATDTESAAAAQSQSDSSAASDASSTVTAMAASQTETTGHTNQVPNSRFDGTAGQMPTGWGTTGVQQSCVVSADQSSPAYTAGQIVSLRRTNTGFQGLQRNTGVPLVAGKTYSAAISIRTMPGVNPTTAGLYLTVGAPNTVTMASQATLQAQPVGVWVRYKVTFLVTTGTPTFSFISLGGNVGEGFDIMAPQIDEEDVAGPYIPTTDAGAVTVSSLDEASGATSSAVARVESTTAAETSNRSMTTANAQAEAVSAIDTTAGSGTAAVAATDTSAPTETSSITAVMPAARTEPTTATETSNRVPSLARAQADAGSAAEAGNVLLMYADRSQAEPATATDSEAVTFNVPVTAVDTGTVTDTSDRLASIARTQAEAGAAADAESAQAVNTQLDAGAATDTTSGSGTASVARTEPTTATEAADRSMTSTAARTEPAAATETSNRTPTMARAQTEAGAGVDAPQVILMYATAAQADAGSATDSEVIVVIAPASQVEATAAANTQDRVASISGTQTDAGAGVDAQAVQQLYAARSQSEAGSATDTEVSVMVASATVSEIGTTQLVPGTYPAYTAQDLFSFSRTTVGTYFDASGNLQTANPMAPRFQNGGLLIEPAAINTIRNNTNQGALAGSPGKLPNNWTGNLGANINGLSIRVSAVGTENGIPYIDLEVNGTCTTAFTGYYNIDSLNRVPASLGQTWTGSMYSKMVSGTMPVAPRLITSGRFAAGGDSDDTIMDLNLGTGPLSSQRTVGPRTMTNAGTATIGLYLAFNFAAGTTYLYTIRLGGPQMEQNATATSLILSSGSDTARDADVAWLFPQAVQSETLVAQRTYLALAGADDTQTVSVSQTQTDAGSATDAESAAMQNAQSEAGTAADAPNRTLTAPVTRSDSTPVTETSDRSSTLARVQTDAGAGADAPNVLLMYANRSQTDAASATDTEIALAVAAVTELEIATAVHQQAGQTSAPVTGSEPATATDSPNRTLTAATAQTDAGASTDTPAIQLMYSARTHTEPATATDTEVALMIATGSANETGSATDTGTGSMNVPVSRTDTGTVTETTDRSLTAFPATTESTTATDTRSASAVASRTEPSTATDTPVAIFNVPVTRSDSTPVSETTDRSLTASRNQTEANAAVDTPSTAGVAMAKGASEGTSASDAVTGKVSTLVDQSEQFAATDTSNRTLQAQQTQTEPATATDTPVQSLTAQASRTDNSTPTETQSTVANISAGRTDNESLTDTQSQTTAASASRAEPATATDVPVGTMNVPVTRTESTTPTDTQTSNAQIIRTETEPANAVDVPSSASQNSVAESTTPTDQQVSKAAYDSNVAESATPTDTSNRTVTIIDVMQELAQAYDLQSASATLLRTQADILALTDTVTVVSLAASATQAEPAFAVDVINGMVTKLAAVVDGASASDLQAAAVTMLRMLQEQNPATDLASAVAASAVAIVESANAKDLVGIAFGKFASDTGNATDTSSAFLFDANRMLLLFDPDCHC